MPHFVQLSEARSTDLAFQFLERHHISADLPSPILLHQLASAFSRLPYENLSKVLRDKQTSQPDEVRRLPSEVLNDYYQLGAGGTCFSLTWTLLQLLRALGFVAEPLLADRRYGPDTHSALVVLLDGIQHLLDPGYLLTRPIPLHETNCIIVPTSFQELHLTTQSDTSRLDLHTFYQNKLTYRLTYKIQPVDTATYLLAWDNSFKFDMMNYPVLSRIDGDKQFYLQKHRLMIRGKENTDHLELSAERLPKFIQQHFGVHPLLIQQALPLFTSFAR